MTTPTNFLADAVARRVCSGNLFRLSAPASTESVQNKLNEHAERARSAVIDQLRSNLQRMQHGLRRQVPDKDIVSTGVPEFDAILPDSGLARGTLSEWIAAEPGSGAISLAMRVASRAQRQGPLIVIDGQRHFYSPALSAAGVDLDKTIFVWPKTRADELWAVEQSLRCAGVGAVLYQIDHLRTQEFLRLQLAVESGTAVGLLIRSAATRNQSGWADVRLLVSSRSSYGRQTVDEPRGRTTTSRTSHRLATVATQSFRRQLEVQCVYAKGAIADRTVELDICDETGAVCVAAGLSDPAASPRRS